MKLEQTAMEHHERGTAYIEYLVAALIVMTATVAFIRNELKNGSSGVRHSVTQAFVGLCGQVAGASCASQQISAPPPEGNP